LSSQSIDNSLFYQSQSVKNLNNSYSFDLPYDYCRDSIKTSFCYATVHLKWSLGQVLDLLILSQCAAKLMFPIWKKFLAIESLPQNFVFLVNEE
jgi:hypothetical protein